MSVKENSSREPFVSMVKLSPLPVRMPPVVLLDES